MNVRELSKAIEELADSKLILQEFKELIHSYKNIIIIGNGGSNAVAQHIAQDYTKVLDKKALCFADASRLTCYFNDYGLEYAYSEFIKDFADSETLVIAISSSGTSKNIYNVCDTCSRENIPFIILTGFYANNHIRRDFTTKALFEFWVDSMDYGIVEIAHEALLHSVC